jgi:sigma-E factor negative regulatory protein RseC
MTETGKIKQVQGTSVTIARENNSACFGCLDQECKAKAFSYGAENTAGLPLRPGQVVETETVASPLKQGLAVLVPPLLGFIVGYTVIGAAFPTTGEPPRAAGGTLLLFVAAAAIYFIRRRNPPKIIRRVVRIVEES